ncbi:hypothetical protein HDE_11456 [Halotydeus destructor]|nr:hypothetical protein HDE_11456 [Halotydeus destructor]
MEDESSSNEPSESRCVEGDPRTNLDYLQTNCATALTQLDLQRCSLSSLPGELAAATRLKFLNVSGNRLSNIELNQPLTSLEVLNLDFNQLALDTVIRHINGAFPNLVELSAAFQLSSTNCDLNELSVDDFQQLKDLNVSGNNLTNLRTVRGNGHIERLSLHTNGLTSLPDLVNCSTLQTLDLSNNCLTMDQNANGFPSEEFNDLINQFGKLNSVDITGNHPSMTQLQCKCELFSNFSKNISSVQIEPSPEQFRVAFAHSFTSFKTSIIVHPLDSDDQQNQLLIALVRGVSVTNDVRRQLPLILISELNCCETSNQYLKNTLISFYRLIKETSANTSSTLDIALCHVTFDETSSNLRLNLSASGLNVSIHLVDTELGDGTQVTNLSPKYTNSSKVEGELLDPVSHELVIESKSSLLLMGIHANSADPCVTHEPSLIRDHFTLDTLDKGGLNDAIKRYSERIKGLPDFGHTLIAVQLSAQSAELEPEAEDNEKFRSWEYILEENSHKVFQANLDTISVNSVYSNAIKLKSSGNQENDSFSRHLNNPNLMTTFKI